MDSTNQYIDKIYDAFTKLQVGEQMEIDLMQLGYTGNGELNFPIYFLEIFAQERLTLIFKEDGSFIQRESGTAGIYFKS